MAAQFPEQRLFFTTGLREGLLEPIEGLELRPAHLAAYRDLTRLRYDYPVVLASAGAAAGSVRSLSGVIDDLLKAVAPRGIDGERLRRYVLRLEREIRSLVASGRGGLLSEVWSQAAGRVVAPDDEAARAVMAHVRDKLELDGELADCDAALPPRLITHLWQAEQSRKAKAFHSIVGRLVVKLSDILRAAYIRSDAGQSAQSLRASLGGTHRQAFDFEAMSRLLGHRVAHDELPPARRRRIEWTLGVLKDQPFFGQAAPGGEGREAALGFAFHDCEEAARAFRERLPRLTEVVKAIAIGELEADGRYVEAKDDAFFAHFDEHALSPSDLALFPDYLVTIGPDCAGAPRNASLMELLSSGLPVKVLVQSDDLLEEAAIGARRYAFGVRSVRLANTATALGGVHVMQAPSATLYALRERLARALAHRGPALLSVFAGSPNSVAGVPPYLSAAAALESRAFPAFAYDPYAGDNQAARFALTDNPEAEADWPSIPLEYADENLQRACESVPFTYADFVLADRRYARHFARVPREQWTATMVPLGEWLERHPHDDDALVPYLLAVDAGDGLHRVIVDNGLVHAAIGCRTLWHRLQEQGGIHNSHAERVLARERAAWEAERQRLEAERERAPAAAEPAASKISETTAEASLIAAVSAPEEAPPAEHSPDEAWIETSRCPSCNECQLINDKVFAYNENKQAYITDVKLGTYRQLVEAAENCQVSIIHPGKPWNPKEPGLEELLERARPFA